MQVAETSATSSTKQMWKWQNRPLEHLKIPTTAVIQFILPAS